MSKGASAVEIPDAEVAQLVRGMYDPYYNTRVLELLIGLRQDKVAKILDQII